MIEARACVIARAGCIFCSDSNKTEIDIQSLWLNGTQLENQAYLTLLSLNVAASA